MVKSPNSRRGRCPHRPETWRAEPAGINLPPCCRTLGPMKGIGPYASGKIVPCNQVRTNISGLPSTPGPAGPPSPSRRGQGFPSSVRAYALPPSPEGKAASGGGLPSTCYVAYRVFLQGILPQAVTQLWKGAVRKGISTKILHSSFTSCGEIFFVSQEVQAAG